MLEFGLMKLTLNSDSDNDCHGFVLLDSYHYDHYDR